METATATPATRTERYLLSALTTDSKKALSELSALIKDQSATVEKEEDLGERKLTFAVNKHRELNLVSVFFQATGDQIKALQAELDHATTIERFLLTRWRAGLEEPRRRRHIDRKEEPSDV